MEKLLKGIVAFHENVRPSYREKFAELALGQKPDCLFVACSDSRVVPNLFASTDPGDLFVVRNVGNLVPACNPQGITPLDRSVAVAIEFAVQVLKVRDIIICGHSECGAMRALLEPVAIDGIQHLDAWLSHAHVARRRLEAGLNPASTDGAIAGEFAGEFAGRSLPGLTPGLAPHNQLSQLNTLCQVEHLQTHPVVAQAMQEGRLRLHAWWFDIAEAEVLRYDAARDTFVVIGEEHGERGAGG